MIGRGRPLVHAALPWIAVPTTAGAGSEVTRNAVIASPAHRYKASVRGTQLFARVAVVDPELALSLPPAVTANCGMDALTQLIEPYVSHRANPLTDALCTEGIRRAARSLVRAFADGRDLAARTDMAVASLFGGIALANAGLGAVHGFASPIGGMFDAPHGAVCTALLPAVIEANLQALRERAPQSDALRRYDDVGRLLTGRADASAADGLAWVRATSMRLDIAPLRAWGVTEAHVADVVDKAAAASSTKANPIALHRDELALALRRSL